RNMPAITAPPNLRRLDSTIGRLQLTRDGHAITSLTIESHGHLPGDDQEESTNRVLERAAEQLTQYFAGKRRSFTLPTAPGGSEFQRQVWQGLTEVPWGEVRSYGELGAATGRATAGRAVGGAVGANPLPIIIPCLR